MVSVLPFTSLKEPGKNGGCLSPYFASYISEKVGVDRARTAKDKLKQKKLKEIHLWRTNTTNVRQSSSKRQGVRNQRDK